MSRAVYARCNAVAYTMLAVGMNAFSRRRTRTVFSLPMELFGGSLLAAGTSSACRSSRHVTVRRAAEAADAVQSALLLSTVLVTAVRAREIFSFPAANLDALTGIGNRKAFEAEIAKALHSNGKQHIAVLYIDLDRFKVINDDHGHFAGDAVLVEVAGRVQAAAVSLAARLGGDEFACIVEDGDDASLETRAMGLLDAIQRPIDVNGATVTVGASVGWARVTEGDSAESLLQRADRSMYAVKRALRTSSAEQR